jgi:hypothetical protein
MHATSCNREFPVIKKNLLALALLAVVCPLGLSADPGGPGDPPGAATAPQAAQDDRPAITLDLEAGTIDLAATMVGMKPEWLELIATTEGGREHEAIVTLAVKPSRLHLALVTLGLEPGHPLRRRQVDGQTVIEPAAGPALRLSFIYEANGQRHETPVEAWVIDKTTGEPLATGRWLFAGSEFKAWKGREYYMADEAGSAVSLVNFGDDLIVYQTEKTQDTDFQELQINPDTPLPYGAPLTLRIYTKPLEPAAEVPAEPSDKPAPDRP